MVKIIKRLFTLIVVLISSINFSPAQITFQKTFGGTDRELGSSVQQTTDGGYIIVGQTESFGAGSLDVYLIKTNVNGDTLWTKTFGEPNAGGEQGYSVQQTTDGGYIIIGEAGYKLYLIKTDANGDSLWTKAFGGISIDWGYSVQQTADGGYIVVGPTGSFGAGNGDVYLIKTDTNGDLLWTKTFGGTDADRGYSVQQTTDSGYVITGRSRSFGAGDYDVYLIKTDSNGDSLWTKTYGGTGDDEGMAVQQTTDGGYIITGWTRSFGTGNAAVYLIKTDASGDLLWSKTYGVTTNDIGNSVQQTTDGGYIICGNINTFGGIPDVYLVKTDANGDTLWTKTFGGVNYDYGNSVQQTADGGYIIVGNTSSFGAGFLDVYLIKTDTSGNSGCNQASTPTIVTTPATQVTGTATIVTSPATNEFTQLTMVGSAGNVTALCTTAGVHEISNDNSFLISPNPSSGNFIISFEGTIMTGNVEVLNILGENIFTENIFNESKKEIHLKNISGGIYFVKVFDGEKYYCKKIIINQN